MMTKQEFLDHLELPNKIYNEPLWAPNLTKFKQISNPFTKIDKYGEIVTHLRVIDMEPGNIYMLVFGEGAVDESIHIYGVRSNICYGADSSDISDFKLDYLKMWQTSSNTGSTVFTPPTSDEMGLIFWNHWIEWNWNGWSSTDLTIYELSKLNIFSLNYPNGNNSP
jgi:hypothetical protein